ncbi:hypothetical protein [Aquimarina sp. MMG016]|uniref:hypothetical protein n=1 Tax=Aquimarina sp. MMG016 TaxID=2822690 RepID=UPI001B3A6F03|nr:hypothetical protein [Aquimarina sp. MMG016]MBQ4822433.1 hypothetical protein [Aquimarina sp. MMG016]
MPNYRDDFFTAENIIGYTGELGMNPTVYFRDGDYFGRITQDHGHADNIGRNIVRFAPDYKIVNDISSGSAYEYYDGAYRHKSRNKFIPVSSDSLYELELAINKFKEIKPKYK